MRATNSVGIRIESDNPGAWTEPRHAPVLPSGETRAAVSTVILMVVCQGSSVARTSSRTVAVMKW
jgi:hypothetical protein